VSVVADPDPPPPAAADGQGAHPCARLEFDPPDGQLLDRIANGDAGAVAALYDRYSRRAYTLARRVCEDQDLAEEVVYQVFLSIWRDPRRFDDARDQFCKALLTLTHRQAVYARCQRSGVSTPAVR
jgi:DNA-directed RNA polymerase specialized sigma24 family protein